MERTYSIDILKIFCAVLVVFLHTQWVLSDAFIPFTRCAVPCFFIISGYLLFDTKGGIKPERIRRSIISVAKITIWASLLFVFWREIEEFFNQRSLFIPRLNALLELLLFNNTPFGWHLWYLFAYLYVLFVMLQVNTYNLWKVLYCLIPVLLLTNMVLGAYSEDLFGYEQPVYLFRNFIFTGIPFFSIGTLIKKNNERLIGTKKRRYLYGGGGGYYSLHY